MRRATVEVRFVPCRSRYIRSWYNRCDFGEVFELSLKAYQYAVTIAAAIISAWLLLYKSGFKDIQLDLFCGLITVIALIVDLWLEIKQVHSTQHTMARNLKTHSLTIDPSLLDGSEGHHATVRLLQPISGLAKVRRSRILKEVKGHLERYKIPFPRQSDEYARISVLAEVIEHAERYVLAYTHASPDYLLRFWGNHKHEAIDKYFHAHRVALKAGRKIKRVFVVPDDLNTAHPDAFLLLLDVIVELQKCGMSDAIYYLTESAARQAYSGGTFPSKSFLVADDVFVSEGEGGGPSKKDDLAYCLFTTLEEECTPFVDAFKALEGCTRGPLSQKELQELLRHRRAAGTRA